MLANVSANEAKDELWAIYAWWSCVLVLKMMSLSWFTGRIRVEKQVKPANFRLLAAESIRPWSHFAMYINDHGGLCLDIVIGRINNRAILMLDTSCCKKIDLIAGAKTEHCFSSHSFGKYNWDVLNEIFLNVCYCRALRTIARLGECSA